MAMKTPITLSAQERQDQMARDGMLPAEGPTHAKETPSSVRARLYGGENSVPSQASRPSVLAERQAGPSATAGMRPGTDFDGSTMMLPPSQIETYDKNPRTAPNPLYEEIKESIRVKGILSPLTVTRRPGGHYFVYGGGNTRLRAAKEIFREDPTNPHVALIRVVFKEWKGDADVIAAHLIENEARGDTTFWDRVNGMRLLKTELEAEHGGGRHFSSSELRTKAATLGWKVSRTTVQLYQFADEYLAPIGPWLKYGVALVIRERFTSLSALIARLAPVQGHGAMVRALAEIQDGRADALRAAASLAAESLSSTAQEVEVDSADLCQALDAKIAELLKCSVADLNRMRDALASNPQATAAQLRGASGDLSGQHASAKEGVVPPPTDTPVQQLLPTTMLAAVPRTKEDSDLAAAGAGAAQADAKGSAASTKFTSLAHKGALPPELNSSASEQAIQHASPERSKAQLLLDAAVSLATAAHLRDLIRLAPHMPLGFILDLPEDELGPLQSVALPEAQQRQLRQGAWQILALISGQMDARLQVAQALPGSAWLQAAQAGQLPHAMARCGVTIDGDGVTPKLDAASLFYLLTEPRALGPRCRALLAALEGRQSEMENVLPLLLQVVPRSAAA